jgi:L-amino acid N-acyltransferase YncA
VLQDAARKCFVSRFFLIIILSDLLRRGGWMEIRDAGEGDLAKITVIYNEILQTSTAIFSNKPASVEERREWWTGRVEQGYPVVVAVVEGVVAGFATYGPFRSWPGYRFTVEHTVHVDAGFRGRGLGAALLRELMERARGAGKHVMVGGIDAANEGSLRFHDRMGFERVAHMKEVGFKFDRFLDLVLVQRRVD